MRYYLTLLFLSFALIGKAQMDTFDADVIQPFWQYLEQPAPKNYQQDEGRLKLVGDIYRFTEEGTHTCLTQPLRDGTFAFETKLTLMDADDGDEAGLLLYRSRDVHVQCCLNNFRGDHRVKLRLQVLSHKFLLLDRSIGTKREIWLRASLADSGRKYDFSYSLDGKKYHWIESVETRLLSPEATGCTAPMQIGIYSFMGSVKYQAGYSYALFDYAGYAN